METTQESCLHGHLKCDYIQLKLKKSKISINYYNISILKILPGFNFLLWHYWWKVVAKINICTSKQTSKSYQFQNCKNDYFFNFRL